MAEKTVVSVNCAYCGGTGKAYDAPCIACDGSGKLEVPNPPKKCHYCNGKGAILLPNPCTVCGGTGWRRVKPLY